MYLSNSGEGLDDIERDLMSCIATEERLRREWIIGGASARVIKDRIECRRLGSDLSPGVRCQSTREGGGEGVPVPADYYNYYYYYYYYYYHYYHYYYHYYY